MRFTILFVMDLPGDSKVQSFIQSEPSIQFHCDQWPHPYQDICYSNRGINKSERAGKRDELEKLKGGNIF